MKKYILMFVCMIMCACQTHTGNIVKVDEEIKSFNQDPVKVIEAYTFGIDSCNIYCNEVYHLYSEQSQKENCINNCKYKLKEQDIQYTCLEDFYGNQKYSSDECILHRRNLHKSSVGYFDYKRFLSKDTFIDSDEKFLTMVNYYRKAFKKSIGWDENTMNKEEQDEYLTKECNKDYEKTSQELKLCKQELLSNLLKPIYSYEKYGLKPCSDVVPNLYKNYLKKKIEEYKYYEKEYKKTISNKKYLEKELKNNKEILIKDINLFGENNLCLTDSYKKDCEELGLKL